MEPLTIYTDGSCPKNGKPGALAGYGVYFGENDPRNISWPCPGTEQTNNRAELMAFIYALQYACLHEDTPIHIKVDSTYCLKGYTLWSTGWVRRGWITASGSPVKNKDLWLQALTLQTILREQDNEPQLSWVKGHSGDPGNEGADKLAFEGVGKHEST